MSILNFKIGWAYKGKNDIEPKLGTYTVWHEGFKRNMSDWTKIWQRLISEVLMPFVIRQFRSQGGEGQRQWAELAPTTLKRRLYPLKPILQQTGMLQMSFVGGPDHVEEVEPKRMKWGSQLPYAIFHQTGTGIKVGDPTPRGYEFKPSLRIRRGAAHAGGHWEPTEKGRGMPQRPILDLYWLKVAELGKEYSPWNEKMIDIVTHELREFARRVGFSLMTPEERAMPGAASEALRIGDIALGNI
jgi:hypothetical protein